jgi:hypothetical protein
MTSIALDDNIPDMFLLPPIYNKLCSLYFMLCPNALNIVVVNNDCVDFMQVNCRTPLSGCKQSCISTMCGAMLWSINPGNSVVPSGNRLSFAAHSDIKGIV